MKLYRYLFVFSIIIFFSSCKVIEPQRNAAIFENVGPYLYYYEGIQNRLYGNPEKAVENLHKSLELNPDNSAVYYELALAYAALNDQDNTVNNIEQAVNIEPDNIYYRNFLGIIYINQDRFQDALNNQLALIDLDSTNLNHKFQIALIYSNLSQFDKALNELEIVEKSYGFLPRVSETKIKIYFQLNKIEEAKEEVDKLVQYFPENPIYLLYKSDLLFKEGYDSLGFEKIYEAIRLEPTLTVSLIELYQRQMETGLVIEGLSSLKIIFNKDQISAEEKASLFYPILFEQNLYTNYFNSLDTIINIGILKHSKSIQMNELGFEHFIRRNSFNSARTCLQNLTKLDKDNPSRLEKLISFDYSLNQKELVIYNSIKAANEFPQYYIFYIFQALAFEEMGDDKKSISALNTGIAKVTDNLHLSELYGTLGDIYYKKEIFKDAFKSYSYGLKHNPNNARILNNYSYYLAITGYKLDKALDMSSKAVELEPNNSTYIDTKGWVLFIMERYDESRDVLRNAIAKSGSNSAVINEHYGDALYKTGNKDNAYIYWLKAKEIEGGSSKLDEKIRTKTYIP